MRRLSMLLVLVTGLSAGGLLTAAPASAEYCNGSDLIETWCKDPWFGTWCMYNVNLPTGAGLCVVGHELE